ncbi:hypothetical protein ACEU6E_10455 (plasmid) [Halorutilales archaeon Cl-col2-1]
MTERPPAPSNVPKYVRKGVNSQDANTLRDLSKWAEELAEWKENRELSEDEIAGDVVEQDVPDDWDEDEWEDLVDDLDAPAKATLTVKTIEGSDYYYYQWREGEKIKSEYVAPVGS